MGGSRGSGRFSLPRPKEFDEPPCWGVDELADGFMMFFFVSHNHFFGESQFIAVDVFFLITHSQSDELAVWEGIFRDSDGW